MRMCDFVKSFLNSLDTPKVACTLWVIERKRRTDVFRNIARTIELII